MEKEICMWKGRKEEQRVAGAARRSVSKSAPCPQGCTKQSDRGRLRGQRTGAILSELSG